MNQERCMRIVYRYTVGWTLLMTLFPMQKRDFIMIRDDARVGSERKELSMLQTCGRQARL